MGDKLKKKKNTPVEDDDDQSNDDDGEEQLRNSLQEAIGAAMETHPSEFLQCLPECSQHMTKWLQSKQYISLAIFLASDLVRYLKEESQPVWAVFMPSVFQALQSKDAAMRTPATYLINVAAQLPAFAEAT